MKSWDELGRFLVTDPQDVGSDEAIRLMHVYADLVLHGSDRVGSRYPGIAATFAPAALRRRPRGNPTRGKRVSRLARGASGDEPRYPRERTRGDQNDARRWPHASAQ